VALAGSPAAGKMDLLSVVLHEMSHFGGLADQPASVGNDVTNGWLGAGQRHDVIDAFFTQAHF
jgi:hypothetical protein